MVLFVLLVWTHIQTHTVISSMILYSETPPPDQCLSSMLLPATQPSVWTPQGRRNPYKALLDPSKSLTQFVCLNFKFHNAAAWAPRHCDLRPQFVKWSSFMRNNRKRRVHSLVIRTHSDTSVGVTLRKSCCLRFSHYLRPNLQFFRDISIVYYFFNQCKIIELLHFCVFVNFK